MDDIKYRKYKAEFQDDMRNFTNDNSRMTSARKYIHECEARILAMEKPAIDRGFDLLEKAIEDAINNSVYKKAYDMQLEIDKLNEQRWQNQERNENLLKQARVLKDADNKLCDELNRKHDEIKELMKKGTL